MGTAQQNDAVLLPYLRAGDEIESGSTLQSLLCERAQPLARNVIRSKLRVGHSATAEITDEDAAELVSEITLKLLGRLRELRSSVDGRAISNFQGYVAVIAYHACDEYLRKKYPRRYSLKNQLRYVLTHRDGLAVWESETGMVCGFAEWRNHPPASPSGVRRFLDNPQLLAGASNRMNPPELLAAIFAQIESPLKLDDLVSLVAELWQVKDVPSRATSISSEAVDAHPAHVESGGPLDTRLDQRSHLKRLWAEICQLPARQRVALLLGMRDANGRGVLILLPLIGIASAYEIAATLAIPAEKLAQLWNQLPLEDAAIADSLGVTRQQVINLRKCARARLSRRTREFH